MKKLVTYIAQALVDYPDKVNVNEIDSGQTSILELQVAKEDIGKDGKHARAMRTIVSAAAAKLHKRTILEIIE